MPKQTFFNLPDDKRQQITDVAIDEFADNPYAKASISRIVACAGIAKGSFYQYFEDKEDLYDHIINLIAETKAESFSLDHPDPQRVGIFNYMRWIFEASVEFELSHPRLSRIAYRLLNDNPSENRAYAKAMEGALVFYEGLVRLGKAQGDISPDIDDAMAAAYFNLVMSNMGQYIMKRVIAIHGTDWQGKQAIFDFPEARELYEQMLRMLESGMGKRG